MVTLTPAAGSNNGVTLRVPYYLVPRAQANVKTTVAKLQGSATSTTATITNKGGAIPATYDFYAWGLEDGKEPGSKASNDIRAVGVQSFALTATEQLVVFAVNVHNRWSNAATNEFDIPLDVNGDGTVDYTVVARRLRCGHGRRVQRDHGRVRVQCDRGDAVAVRRVRTARQLDDPDPDQDGSAVPADAAVPERGEPALHVLGGRVRPDRHRGPGRRRGTARYNAWTPAFGEFAFGSVAPNATATEPLSINAAEFAQTPALGLMVVTQDNKAGADEADLVKIK